MLHNIQRVAVDIVLHETNLRKQKGKNKRIFPFCESFGVVHSGCNFQSYHKYVVPKGTLKVNVCLVVYMTFDISKYKCLIQQHISVNIVDISFRTWSYPIGYGHIVSFRIWTYPGGHVQYITFPNIVISSVPFGILEKGTAQNGQAVKSIHECGLICLLCLVAIL